MSDIEYSVITSDVIKSFDCIEENVLFYCLYHHEMCTGIHACLAQLIEAVIYNLY